MTEDLEAILDRVEEELGSDARATLEEALGLDGDRDGGSGSDLPDDTEEAKDGELKAGGTAEKMATGAGAGAGAGYSDEIGEAFSPGGAEPTSTPGRNPLEGGAAEKMETDEPEPVDYTEEIEEAFGNGGGG